MMQVNADIFSTLYNNAVVVTSESAPVKVEGAQLSFVG
jgi:hypothetical protein